MWLTPLFFKLAKNYNADGSPYQTNIPTKLTILLMRISKTFKAYVARRG